MVNPSGTTAVLLRVIFLTISMVSYLFARYTASYGGSAPSMSFTELSVWDPLAWRASWVLPVDLTSTGVGDVIGKNGKTRKVCTIGVPSSWAFTCKKKPRNRKPSATMARKGPISCFSSSWGSLKWIHQSMQVYRIATISIMLPVFIRHSPALLHRNWLAVIWVGSLDFPLGSCVGFPPFFGFHCSPLPYHPSLNGTMLWMQRYTGWKLDNSEDSYRGQVTN